MCKNYKNALNKIKLIRKLTNQHKSILNKNKKRKVTIWSRKKVLDTLLDLDSKTNRTNAAYPHIRDQNQYPILKRERIKPKNIGEKHWWDGNCEFVGSFWGTGKSWGFVAKISAQDS